MHMRLSLRHFRLEIEKSGLPRVKTLTRPLTLVLKGIARSQSRLWERCAVLQARTSWLWIVGTLDFTCLLWILYF